MNEHTVKVLDYDLIRDELRTYTVTPMGKTLAQQLQPHTDLALLDIQLRETSEMTDLLATGDDPPLAPVTDLRIHVEAAQLAGYYLEGQQFLEVADCLEVLQQLRRFTQHNCQRIPLLARRSASLSDFSIFLRQIRSAIDERGAVRDSASPLLQEIRKTLNHTSERIHRTLLRLMATHSSVVQDAVVTIRNDRFVVPLKTDFRRTLRGIVHGESASGATVYVEPDIVVGLNNHLFQTRAKEERAVREILRELTERLAIQRVAVEQALQLLGEVDLIVAKGRLSQRMHGIAPRITTTEKRLRLVAARHPLLTDPVPIDVHLGPQERTLVITGPNTGGKTAVLKTVGLLSAMAQSGLHIPAHGESELPLCREIFVDMGDEQNLQQNLSTFSAHLKNIHTMTKQVSADSLVLLDELGAGTDPLEGGPLGTAILEYFHASEALTLVTTHHSAIKAFAMATPDIVCAAVDFDLDTLQPRYQLVYGLPGRSKAFAIAQKLGFPAEIITRAEQEAGATQMRSESLLARLEAKRQTMDDEQQRIRRKQEETERLHAEAQQILSDASTEERRIREMFFREGQALLKTARQDLDTLLGSLRQLSGNGTPAAFPRDEWQRVVETIESLAPTPASPQPAPSLQVGDDVRVRGLNIKGRLRTPVTGSGSVTVEVGNKTIIVAASELERADEDVKASNHASNGTKGPPPASLAPELHLRGATLSEAVPAVEKYLDEASLQGFPRVRLIHGIGSGRLRAGIAAVLERHPLVRRFQVGDAGGGVTVVELEG
jgi:DNA mismatch repair protein MutS2